MSFQPRDPHPSPLCKFNHILKSGDKILMEKMLLLSKSINNLSPIFNGWFIFCSDIYNCETISSSTGKLFKASYSHFR